MTNLDPKFKTVPEAVTATPCDAVCSVEGCGSLIGEAHKAIRITLEELAILAGLATADTDASRTTPPDEAAPSAYSLLLENTSFRL